MVIFDGLGLNGGFPQRQSSLLGCDQSSNTTIDIEHESEIGICSNCRSPSKDCSMHHADQKENDVNHAWTPKVFQESPSGLDSTENCSSTKTIGTSIIDGGLNHKPVLASDNVFGAGEVEEPCEEIIDEAPVPPLQPSKSASYAVDEPQPPSWARALHSKVSSIVRSRVRSGSTRKKTWAERLKIFQQSEYPEERQGGFYLATACSIGRGKVQEVEKIVCRLMPHYAIHVVIRGGPHKSGSGGKCHITVEIRDDRGTFHNCHIPVSATTLQLVGKPRWFSDNETLPYHGSIEITGNKKWKFVRREVAGCYNGESDERTGRSRGLASTVAAPVADILEDIAHAEFEKSRRIEQKGRGSRNGEYRDNGRRPRGVGKHGFGHSTRRNRLWASGAVAKEPKSGLDP